MLLLVGICLFLWLRRRSLVSSGGNAFGGGAALAGGFVGFGNGFGFGDLL